MKITFWIASAFVLGILMGQLARPVASAQLARLSVKTTRLLTTGLADYCEGKEVTV